jgi:hypothetical protein
VTRDPDAAGSEQQEAVSGGVPVAPPRGGPVLLRVEGLGRGDVGPLDEAASPAHHDGSTPRVELAIHGDSAFEATDYAYVFGRHGKSYHASFKLDESAIEPEALQMRDGAAGLPHPAKRGSGMPLTPRPWIANRLPRSTPSPGKRGSGGLAMEVT